jgi:Zn finger protein HypA/HybF involved in hydrogenase expression
MQAEVETVEEEVKSDSKARRCLMCLEHFVSEWAGQRVCPRCKSTAAWRAG